MKKKVKKLVSICLATIIASTASISVYAATNGWQRSGNSPWCTWSYYENGVKKKGWLYQNDKWYYLDSNGNMQTGWDYINGYKYYFDWDSGAMLTGWQLLGSYWYYFVENSSNQPIGSMLSDGWYWINDKCYYFNDHGEMAVNTTIGEYRVDASGAWIHDDFSDNLIKNPQDIDDLIYNWNIKYGEVETPIGTINLNFAYDKNRFNFNPYDYWIKTDFEGISLLDLKYSIEFTNSEKEKTIDILKNTQKEVAKDVETYLPNIKVTGGYYSGSYKYPNSKVGYESIRFLTWQNYNNVSLLEEDRYAATKVDTFKWNDMLDDYKF